jgi:hypothetical protein
MSSATTIYSQGSYRGVSGPLWGTRNANAIVHNAKSITQRLNEGIFVVGATDRRPCAVER